MTASSGNTIRQRGRPRSDLSRQAILQAAIELIAEVGYRDTTIEAIAARAGAGKQTIYRWWPGKGELVLDAVTADAAREIPVPDTGDLRADLTAFLNATFAAGRRPGVLPQLRALMAEAQLDPEFGAAFDEQFLRSRREALASLLRRHRGQLRVPVTTAVHTVFGLLWYRVLTGHGRLDATLTRELVTLLVDDGQ
jgi:AcrR family transcriptional regulator